MASMIRKPYCISHKGIIPHPGAKTQKFFEKRPSKEQKTKLQPAGEEHAKIAIAAVRRPPVAVHALRVEVADVHEVAVSGALFSIRFSIQVSDASC